MHLRDLSILAWSNLQRNRTRSVMTLVGICIGIAALVALVSYGAGLQRNARAEFNALELYNTLRVTSEPSPFNSLGQLAVLQREVDDEAEEVIRQPLTDSLVAVLDGLPGVLAAYPEVIFPVVVRHRGVELAATAEAIPPSFTAIPAYQPTQGRYFASTDEQAILIAPSMARRLGYEPAEQILGDTLVVTTAQLNFKALRLALGAMTMGLTSLPIEEIKHPMAVVGLLPEEDQVLTSFFRVILPQARAQQMQKITFFSTIDLLMRRTTAEGYPAVRVQLDDLEQFDTVKASIEAEGVFVSSFREQFGQLERLFLIMDLALGIIGVIALLVATIGIANTMMMNVMERYGEIGVMKAVGGYEGDVKRLFLVESATLGLIGGVSGILLGWLLTRAINWGVNVYLRGLGIPHVDVFYTSVWMVAAVLGLSMLVSLLAGYAPARRAARIEPLEALRA